MYLFCMPEGLKGTEDEPVIELVEGQDVAKYLTPELKQRFIRTLIIANNNGVFDEKYFKRYLYGFEHRLAQGRVTLLLADGEPAALGAVNIVGKYSDGRTLNEMGNLVVLPEFEGRGFASQLMEHRFRKIRDAWPNDPIIVTTLTDKIAQKCLKLGMKEQPMEVEMRIRNPKEKCAAWLLSKLKKEGVDVDTVDFDASYDAEIKEMADSMRRDGYRNYFFDPLEKSES